VNKKLQERLFKKYPIVLQELNPTNKISKTPMAFGGITCGDGWYHLIDNICFLISQYNKQHECYVFLTQIKQKFGTLRIYTSAKNDYISGIITMAETISDLICEECGVTDDIGRTTDYIMNICESCYDELIDQGNIQLGTLVKDPEERRGFRV